MARQATALADAAARSPGRASADVDEPLDGGGLASIQRARLIAALCEVCAECGFDRVSVASVVERAGVSRRTFYEMFADREDCFLAAFERAVALAARKVVPAYGRQDRWVAKIREGLEALLEFFDDEPAMASVLVVGSQSAGPQVLEHRRLLLDGLVAAVDAGREMAGSAPAPTELTAEGIVGGVSALLQARIAARAGVRLVDLRNPLMSMIVLPYLGPKAAAAEMKRPRKDAPAVVRAKRPNPLGSLDMRLTYRTVLVLKAIAANQHASNRSIATAAGVGDQGQISKLLARLERLGLVSNDQAGASSGQANAWGLTARGAEVVDLILGQVASSR